MNMKSNAINLVTDIRIAENDDEGTGNSTISRNLLDKSKDA